MKRKQLCKKYRSSVPSNSIKNNHMIWAHELISYRTAEWKTNEKSNRSAAAMKQAEVD